MPRIKLLIKIMFPVAICLWFTLASTAQNDPCAQCPNTKAACIYNCEMTYSNCLGDPSYDRETCDFNRSNCFWNCDSEYQACRASNCVGWDEEGGDGTGLDPACVAYCDQVEGDCLNGNPILSVGYMDCVDNGGTTSECCRYLRNQCLITCPPCTPRVNCPKYP